MKQLNSRYRYTLVRQFDKGHGTVVFIMLNPSTADAIKDDPTIRRCKGFAQQWGYRQLLVVNLFAARATDPKDLKLMDDPVGKYNDSIILDTIKGAERVIVAWGNHGGHQDRDLEVMGLIEPYCIPFCLGVTGSGSPKHPGRISYAAELLPYAVAGEATLEGATA